MAVRWNAKDDQALTRLWDRGVLGAEIAHRLGRSENGIASRARRLRLTSRKNTKPRKRSLRVHLSDEEHTALRGIAHRRRCSLASLVRLVMLNLGPAYRDIAEMAAKSKVDYRGERRVET